MLTLAALIWGTAFGAQKAAMDSIDPITFIGVRFLIATAALAPVVVAGDAIKRRRGVVARDSALELWGGSLLCGLVLFVGVVLQQVGIQYTTAGKSGFITTLYIVIIPIFGLFLGRRARVSVWCCVALAVAGMYLLCVNESVAINKGDVYTFFCALSYAVHILLVGRYAPKVDGVKLAAIQFLVCGALGSAGGLIFESPDLSDVAGAIGPLLYAGVLSSGVGFTLQVFGQRDVNPVAASLVMSLEAVFAVLTGWLMLSEKLSFKEITGCVLIFAANALVQAMGSAENPKD
jgi:drug/metabolite transporter (DMT)-like permease